MIHYVLLSQMRLKLWRGQCVLPGVADLFSRRPTDVNALALLLLAARHYGYYHVPMPWQGEIFGIFASLSIIVLVVQSTLWWPVKIWAAAEEGLCASCSAAWLIAPWELIDPSEKCSSALGHQLGAYGLALLAWASWRVYLSTITGRHSGL